MGSYGARERGREAVKWLVSGSEMLLLQAGIVLKWEVDGAGERERRNLLIGSCRHCSNVHKSMPCSLQRSHICVLHHRLTGGEDLSREEKCEASLLFMYADEVGFDVC